MPNKRKHRPCDDTSEDLWCRICRNPNTRAKKPCEGPRLPETSKAEPGGSSAAEPMSDLTTRSGRSVVVPTRLDQDAAYVEQLGPLRDVSGHYCRSASHVTKDAQIEALTAEVSELHEQATKLHDALRTLMATHTREMNEKEAQLKTINGKLIASERQAEKLRDKEIGRSQEARQRAFMSNYFAPAKASTSTMAMEAATSAPAVGYTVEQVRAQQSDRSFRRELQIVHLQIIELAGEHPRSHTQAEECEALAKRPTKEIDRAQSAPKKAFTRIFFSLPTKALTSASTMMSMAASAPCELMQVLRGTWQCWLLGCPCPTTRVQRRVRHSRSMPVV